MTYGDAYKWFVDDVRKTVTHYFEPITWLINNKRRTIGILLLLIIAYCVVIARNSLYSFLSQFFPFGKTIGIINTHPAVLGDHSKVVGNALLISSQRWLDQGSNAWQMATATFAGLQAIPGLVILYGGIVKRKWALNSAFMAMYGFAAVMIVWVLWAYNMAFGGQWLPFLGTPKPALSADFLLGQAVIPAAASGMPELGFPMATMLFFQFVFAAITVIILAGSLIGRMNFKAWIIFVPLWMTFDYTVVAFSIWGGGWLADFGVADFSGGYVVHLAAGISGFVAAAVIGPRIQQDRDYFSSNSLLMALAGAGILWLGSNGLIGGSGYFANGIAAAAILNTNLCTCVSLLVWTIMDSMAYGKPSVVGAINGMIAGLVGIAPGAGYVNGWGAIVIGICTGIIPWVMMNKVQTSALFKKVDDTLSVLSTHGVAGLLGGLLVGFFACPDMLVYIGTDKEAPGISVTGLLYGDTGNQLLVQFYAAVFVIAYNAATTFVILKVISVYIPLRMDETALRAASDEVRGAEPSVYGSDSRYSDQKLR